MSNTHPWSQVLVVDPDAERRLRFAPPELSLPSFAEADSLGGPSFKRSFKG